MDPCKLNLRDVGVGMVATAMAASDKFESSSIDLGLSYLARDLVPNDLMRQYSNVAFRLSASLPLPLVMSPGYFPLRKQIALHAASIGKAVDPEKMLITSGGQEALTFALCAVTSPGSSVAIESPASFSILHVIETLRLNPIEIPVAQDGGMSLEVLDFILNRQPISAVVTNCSFQNPTGGLMPAAKKEELTRLLAARGIPLVEDDPCGDLYYGPGVKRPLSCLSFDIDDNVIYCSSFSKTVSPNLCVGWIYPGKWCRPVEHLIRITHHGMSTIPQISLALLLEDGFFPRHLRKIRCALRSRVPAAREAILASFPEGTVVSNPSGGVSLWVTLPGGRSSEELYMRALSAGILVAPGFLFGKTRTYDSCFRVNASVLSRGDAVSLGALASGLAPRARASE